jgi:hypothetical protein
VERDDRVTNVNEALLGLVASGVDGSVFSLVTISCKMVSFRKPGLDVFPVERCRSWIVRQGLLSVVRVTVVLAPALKRIRQGRFHTLTLQVNDHDKTNKNDTITSRVF